MVDLGPYFCSNPHHALLHHVLDCELLRTGLEDVAVEFGTGSGETARCISRFMPVTTFGSSEGLPEDWREGFPKGSFGGHPFDLPSNVTFIDGLFDRTLPRVREWGEVALVHFDADLYSSTVTALRHIGPHLKPGCVLVFDEFHGYPGWETHEARAWAEYVDRTETKYEVIGHGHEAWACRLV